MAANAIIAELVCRRLVGIDGTQFPCGNIPRILGTLTKAAIRRFAAAFAKLGCAVLVELGTHAPLVAAISAPDRAESETALAGELLVRPPWNLSAACCSITLREL